MRALLSGKAPAFQAGHTGSIPVARSSQKPLGNRAFIKISVFFLRAFALVHPFPGSLRFAAFRHYNLYP